MHAASAMTTPAARTLAEFAVGLHYERIPNEVIQRAKTCIIDTIGAMTFGAPLPWSRIMIEYVQRTSLPGKGSIVGTTHKVRGQMAALANGVLAHSFELDSLCQPGVGVHPGASLTAPGIPVAQAQGRSGKELLTAFVAGFEVMYRIGDATCHSSESIGFHNPGLTGVFGGAVIAGLLMKLDSDRMTNALGIAGSLCSGLLEFSRSGGGMVKRMHLGARLKAERWQLRWRVKASRDRRPCSRGTTAFSRRSRRSATPRVSRKASAKSGTRSRPC